MELTHINKDGRGKMVDVTDKDITKREAIASGDIFMKTETINLITNKDIKKGDVLSISQVAGIMATKQTSNLIPMCHNLNLTGCDIEFKIYDNKINCTCKALTTGKTGVEIEAITGVSIALITIYDMCKAVDKDMVISDIKLLEKHGGKSGAYLRQC